MKSSLSRWLVRALVLSSAACSESATGLDSPDLRPSEARSLAFGVATLGTVQVEELAWDGASLSSADVGLPAGPSFHLAGSGPGGPSGPSGGAFGLWGTHRPRVHGTTTTTIERTSPCPQGGTLHSLSIIVSVIDTVARTGEVTTESTDTPDACAFTVDRISATLTTITDPGTVITITGAPSLITRSSSSYSWAESDSTRQHGMLARAPTSVRQTGSFTYTTSDARSGTCDVDLTTTFDPDARTQSVTGTFCGHAIDVTSPLMGHRGRGGGHRR